MKKLFFIASLLLALTSSAHSDRVFYDSAHPCVQSQSCASHDFVEVGRAASKRPLTLTFAVVQRNLDQLERELYAVSDPSSARYGKHLSFEQVHELTTDVQAMKAVVTFVRRHPQLSLVHVFRSGFVKVRGLVQAFEKLLDTKFYRFHSEELGYDIVRTYSYSLPKQLGRHVQLITGTIQFPSTNALRQLTIRQRVANADGTVVPSLLNSYYNIDSNSVSANSTQSVFESLGQDYSPQDLKSFEQKFNIPEQGIAKVIGPNNPKACGLNPNNCIEANLDVEYIIAVANAPTTFWSIGKNAQDPFLQWAMAVASTPDVPLVHSISYGAVEDELPQNDLMRFNTEMQKLGVRGITVMVASGDDGVANYIARSDPSKCGFNPSFPASSPYVTAVGATQGPEDSQPEIACTSSTQGQITTGGGFSTVYGQPSYQSSAVSNYLQNGPNLPPTNMFNASGRGYPDVAMMGHNYVIGIGGSFYQGSGTSAAAPVFAGLVSLVNDARSQNGDSPVGFINPALYSSNFTSVFNDITSGENNCCAAPQYGNPVCCKYGFTATTGWDPLTGMGSVDYEKFVSAFTSM